MYSYDRRVAAKQLNLAHWGLEGLAEGKPVTLYHGTTRSFTTFDMGKSRTELVDKYYGAGIFLLPAKRVADQYANANRNMGFDPSIIDALKRKNPRAGAFMQTLYKEGKDGWESFAEELKKKEPNYGEYPMVYAEEYLGVDPNTVDDVCGYIEGSKIIPLYGGGSGNPVLDIFHGSTGTPSYIYDSLDQLGLDSNEYRPKIYTVEVTVKNPLVTANKAQAKSAPSKGYDCVVFHGADLVGGVPEVAVYDARNVKIRHVEVVG